MTMVMLMEAIIDLKIINRHKNNHNQITLNVWNWTLVHERTH